MQTVGQIIRQRRETLGQTLASLATQVQTTKSYLSMIENHRVANPPSPALLQRLESALDISPGELRRAADWANTPSHIRTIVQQMSDSALQSRKLAQHLQQTLKHKKSPGKKNPKDFPTHELHKLLRSTLQPTPALDNQIPIAFRIPLINKVAAGYPADFSDLDYPARIADEYISVPNLNDPNAFAARVVGESMLPDYRQGDIVVFSPAAKITPGSDCFVRLLPDHHTTFKRIFFDPDNHIRLQPLNPQFPPSSHPREQISGLYKAVWRFQQLP